MGVIYIEQGIIFLAIYIHAVMEPWHVVMGKAEYGHNAGNELRRVRHYLSAQEQKCDGSDCTACRLINGEHL